MIIKRFNEVFHTTQYPAGEQHIEMVDNGEVDVIVADCRNWNDLMNCWIGQAIITRLDMFPPQWVVPYMPFARHDRRNHMFDGLELPGAIEVVKQLRGSIIDPHSDVAGQLPHYSQAQVVEEYLMMGLFDRYPVIAVPDAGAIKKVDTWFRRLHSRTPHEVELVQCLKKRDPLTGKLSGFQVLEPEKVRGQNVVIVDDICDAGGTFLGLGEELRNSGANALALAVTHGLFTKGLEKLLDMFNRIYTLDIYEEGYKALDLVSTHSLIEGNLPE